MIYNPRDEFPHTIEIGHRDVYGDFPHQEVVFTTEDVFKGFMDTPSAQETLAYHQMNNDYQRNLYVPFRITIDTEKNLIRYFGKTYEFIGDGVDQGGMNEINLYRLREVNIHEHKV